VNSADGGNAAAPGGTSGDVQIDPQHPWLGLSSYTEETRAYFHGRDEEAAELARRVQRKNLTILFGQSGLGKTSLLRAGLVPRLRGEGYCPVYVRVDYAPESPPPAEQIKQAIFRATAAAGHWTRPGTAVEGESLWEFLHHRGDLLRDASGHTVLPLLIFDQFEEIFTLAQVDDTGRRRAQEFLDELADLVENRPPAALEKRFDEDEAAAEDFDFARADYRVLIALREDYLAHLEGVKGTMPSITQNRMRLARMTGAQALSAVTKPGGRLVSQEVAEAIVRFVAGGSELANAEVEPSLLSLVCRELNNVRISRGRSEITADLLAGSRDTILSEFYERALADQPAGVRRVIEDELLTESGYRESLAEERVAKSLAAAGAAPDALAKLVDRRLLRIEERLDVRRVELMHDVLCSVVASSRDVRHEREARDDAERQLAAQREREATTRRALVRARAIATVCAVLLVVAAAGALFGWINLKRARAADVQAQQARMLAEKARGDAEKLVGFLIEDFYAELAPTGRLDTMGKLAHQAVAYYDGLPAELITPQTQIYHGMALIREGQAQLGGKDVKAGTASVEKARAMFEKLHAASPKNEAVAYGLGLSMLAPYYAWGPGGGPGSKPHDLQVTADLLRPFAYAPGATRQIQITYADTLNYLSHSKDNTEEGIADCEEARKLLASLGALDLSDLNATAAYADVTDSEARHAMTLGRFAQSAALENKVYELAEKALVKRPGDLRSMFNRYFAADMLGRLASVRHDYAEAVRQFSRATQAGEEVARFNPTDLQGWGFWINGRDSLTGTYLEMGRLQQAIDTARGTVALADDPRLPSSLDPQLDRTWFTLAVLQAELGRTAAANAALASSDKSVDEFIKMMPEGDPRIAIAQAQKPLRHGRIKLLNGDAVAALSLSTQAVHAVEQLTVAADSPVSTFRGVMLQASLGFVCESSLRLGKYAEAESACSQRLSLPPSPLDDDPQQDMSRRRLLLALAIAKQNRGPEALKVLAPALAYYKGEKLAHASGTLFRRDYAEALYAYALAQPVDAAGREARAQALAQAAELLSGASSEVKQTVEMRELAGWIAEARKTSGA
jgi:hypothetical protein